MNQKLSNRFRRGLLFLACLAAVGCGQEEMSAPETPADDLSKVILTFSASPGLTTRTALTGPGNLQHVREVWLYIFEGTGADAPCVASEDVDWKDKAGEEGLPEKSQRYSVKYKGFQANADYTVLAVGLDDRSGEAYGLPGSVEVGRTLLGDAKAVLATGKSREDIAVSELFGGSSVLTINEAGGGSSRIDLYRRVAGVMGWFKNIPRQVKGTDVASLRIELYKAQNKSAWLAKPQSGMDVIMEPVEETEDNKILVRIDLVEADFQPDAVVSGGSYVLPMIAPFATEEAMRSAGYADADIYVKDYTLRVILADASGNALKTSRVKIVSRENTDTDTDIGLPDDIFRFPLTANYFYSIGEKDEPVEIPEGNIVIEVNPDWIKKIDLEWQ